MSTWLLQLIVSMACGVWHVAVQVYHANHHHVGKLAGTPASSSWAQPHCTQQNQN